MYRRQWSRQSPRKRNAKRQNGCLTGLQISEKRSERQRRKGKIFPVNAVFQRLKRRDKNIILSEQCKEIEENNRMGMSKDLFKKIRTTGGTFHANMGTKKDRNSMDLTEAEEIKKRWKAM